MARRSGIGRRIVIALVALGLAAGGGATFWLLRSPGPKTFPQVDALLARGETAQALDAAERLLRDRPDDPDLSDLIGRLRFALGDYGVGEERLESLVRREPRPGPRLLELARLEEDAFRRAEAAAAASRALAADPELAGARAILARNHLVQSRFEEARDLLSPVVSAGRATPDEVIAFGKAILKLGDPARAAAILAGPATESGARPEDRAAYGEALLGAGDHRRAADFLAALLEEDPWYGRAYYLLGSALSRLGDLEAAKPAMTAYSGMRAVEHRWMKTEEMDKAGVRSRACYERALVHAEMRRYGKAVEECRRGSRLRPDGVLCLAIAVELADCEASAESEEVAAQALERRLDSSAGVLYLRGEIRRQAGRPQEALAWYDRALAILPTHASSLIARARLALEAKRLEEADAFVSQARAAGVATWEVPYWSGRVALARGDALTARGALVEADRLAGGSNAEVRAALGIAAIRTGARDEGLRALLEAIKAAPANLEVLAFLEEGLTTIGETDRAAAVKKRREKVDALLGKVREQRAAGTPFEARGKVFLEIGKGYREEGLRLEAIRWLSLARGAAPDLAEAHRALAELHESPESAFFRAQALREVLRISPGDAAASRSLALVLTKAGVEAARAAALAEASLKADDAPEGRYVLGEVLLRRGDAEGAAREAREALRRAPGEPRYRDLLTRAAGTGKGSLSGASGSTADAPGESATGK